MSYGCFRFVAILTVALALALAAGCAQLAPKAAPAEPLADDAGRTVTLTGSVDRIVSLAPSNTELLYALGLGDKVVGVTSYDDYPPEVKDKPKIGGFADVDAEKVVALSPDLVVAANIHVAKVVPALEKLGLKVVVVDPKSVDDIGDRLITLGRLTGKEKEAREVKAKLDQRITATIAKAKEAGSSPRVFWMLGEGHTVFTAGPGSYADDLIRKAGGINIAADAKTQWPELSLEAVLKADPEVIVIPGEQGPAIVAKLKADPVWQGVSAVKTGRFVLIPDQNLVHRPGPRIVDGLDAVARGLHPEQFK